MTPSEIKAALIARWTDNVNPVMFAKSALYDVETKCRCAQGDALHAFGGWSDRQLQRNTQAFADREVAKLLGITVFESVVLRMVNDSEDGAPASVLTDPEHFYGPDWQTIIALFRHLDGMSRRDFNLLDKRWWAVSEEDIQNFIYAVGDVSVKSTSFLENHLNAVVEDAGFGEPILWGICEIQFAKFIYEKNLDNTKFHFMNALGFKTPNDLLNNTPMKEMVP